MTAETVPEIPITRTCPFAPLAEHAKLRAETPITKVKLPTGATVWALTRHEDIRAMLLDTRFSSNQRHPQFPRATDVQQAPDVSVPRSMFELDPPEHTAARQTVISEFTVKRMAALRPRIQQIVDKCIDEMLAGPRPVDLVTALAMPVPSLLLCELLGVPASDQEFFQVRTAQLLSRTVPMDVRQKAVEELQVYLFELIAAKDKEPTDDLLGRQILKQRESGKPTDYGALISLAALLMLAGHETTANMIALSSLILLEKPEALASIRQDPGKTPGAVDELLRYFTVSEFATSRVATEDIEFRGVLIRAGEGVIGFGNTANRDPAAFEDPDEFNIERDARHHLSFGFGPHQCIGQHLARLELQITIDTLFRRIPGLRSAVPIDDLPFKYDSVIFGLYEFPVTW